MNKLAGGSRVHGVPSQAPHAAPHRAKPLEPRRAVSQAPGVAAICPDCPHCGESLVWRSRGRGELAGWQCDGCGAQVSWRTYERLSGTRYNGAVEQPRGIPAEALAGVPVFSSYLADKSASSDQASVFERSWLDHLEAYTSPFRRRRALRHLAFAEGPSNRALWHQQRYTGQAARFERIRACGAAVAMLEGWCPTTGEVLASKPFEARCKCWRACSYCLRNRQHRLGEDVDRVREEAFLARSRQCSPRYRGSEGRWSERLVTLTVPHSGSPGDDAALLSRAWAEFQRRWLDHLRVDRDARKKPVWVRALEVAPGESGGHAHLHVWYLGPFVDHAWARITWGRILESMGRPCPQKSWEEAMRSAVDKRSRIWCRTRRGRNGRATASVPWPHVYINSAKNEGGASYATKVGVQLVRYVVKGSKEAERLHPLHAATIYEALEGARCVQWARGWAPRRQSELMWTLRRMTEAERLQWVSSVATVKNACTQPENAQCEPATDAPAPAAASPPTGPMVPTQLALFVPVCSESLAAE